MIYERRRDEKNKIIYLTSPVFACVFAASGILYGCGGATSGNTAETENTSENVTEEQTDGSAGSPRTIADVDVDEDVDYGGVIINASYDDLSDAGYEFGDSLNVTFSNGYTLEDVPYYNGYYVPPSEILV